MLLTLIAFSCTISQAVSFLPRSQSVNAARELCGWTQKINKYGMNNAYGTAAITLAGGRSFNNDNITRCLFGQDVSCGSCPTLKISGSRVANRGDKDWLADYFGLPTDFQSRITFQPRIHHFVADFNGYLGLDEWVKGMFVRVHVPIAWNKWDLNMHEQVIATGTADHEAGYFCENVVEREQLLNNFTSFMNGNVPTLCDGTKFKQLCDCRILPCSETLTKAADVRIIVGYNFLSEYSHMGLGILFAAPTGNAPDASRVFSPVVGNGNHFEFGAHFTSHYSFYSSSDKASSMGIYIDANISHLFKDGQEHCFDLCGKPNSKYMLAQKIQSNVNSNPKLTGDSDAGFEFAHEYTTVSNLTTRIVDVSFNIQADIVALLNFTYSGLSIDLGYNFWTRSCQEITQKELCDPCDPCSPLIAAIPNNTWALKGDVHVFGFSSMNPFPAVGLAATQYNATINKGTNNFVGPDNNDGGINGIRPTANPGIDQPTLATDSHSGSITRDRNNNTGIQTRSSNEPRFLRETDIDFDSDRSKAQTHKGFAHISYTWLDHENTIPYLGVGFEYEVGQDSCDDCPKNPCDTLCDDCPDCGLSRWEVWIKGGISFH